MVIFPCAIELCMDIGPSIVMFDLSGFSGLAGADLAWLCWPAGALWLAGLGWLAGTFLLAGLDGLAGAILLALLTALPTRPPSWLQLELQLPSSHPPMLLKSEGRPKPPCDRACVAAYPC